MGADSQAAPEQVKQGKSRDVLVIGASSLGTVFEWYDFYLYGSLAPIITNHFFSGVNETTGFILALLAFAAGFAIRPLGAVIFGRLGDLWGRKNTFLITMLLMGLSTFVVGLLPSYAQIGVAAPVLLVVMRLVQGLALGGEYGGAATYVAEHAPPGKRGFYTSWIQTTATIGLFLSLAVILVARTQLGEDAFKAWGWRIPFLVSLLLLGVSLWMVGLTMGQAVVWYTGQFYALFFLEKTLKLDGALANTLVAAGLLIGTPFFVIFGWLSDKIGRKWIIILGCALAAATYFPIFKGITTYANPVLARAEATAPVVVSADAATCAFQFDLIGKAKFNTPCDVAKAYLAKAGVSYSVHEASAGAPTSVDVGGVTLAGFDSKGTTGKAFAAARKAWEADLGDQLKAAGYPAKAESALVDKPKVIGLLALLVIYVTMVYGPIAAMLVELFPTRIRYTAMSLPYHIGNGWFGGFLPTTAFAIVAATGNVYSGLWYPVIIASVTAVIGGLFLKDTRHNPIED
jgi:MFS family permease